MGIQVKDLGTKVNTIKSFNEILGIPVNVKHYGAVGDGIADDTIAIQSAIDENPNTILFFPEGIYNITGITFDETKNYTVVGVGKSVDGTSCSVIKNINTDGGHAISIINNGIANDNQFVFKDINITGNQFSGNGFYIKNIHQFKLYNVWITSNGLHGVYTEDGWSNKLDNTVIAQNGGCGIYAKFRFNNASITNCVINGNSRLDGWSNIYVQGALNSECYGVEITGTDFTGAGENPYTTITNAFGMVLQYVISATISGCYSEHAVTNLVYVDNTSKNIRFHGNYMQDGILSFSNSKNLYCCGNVFQYISATTTLIVESVNTDDSRVTQNTFLGGATQYFAGSISNRKESWGTTYPTTGTWNERDIVWNTAPSSGGYVGWICTEAGTSGTWKGFGLIAV